MKGYVPSTQHSDGMMMLHAIELAVVLSVIGSILIGAMR